MDLKEWHDGLKPTERCNMIKGHSKYWTDKIEKSVHLLNKLIENNDKKRNEWLMVKNFLLSTTYTDQIKELEAIKKILTEPTE